LYSLCSAPSRAGLFIPVAFFFGQRRKCDTKDRLLASIDKVRELIGYNPSRTFEEGLKHTINWFKENWDKIEAAAKFGPGVSSAVREIVVKVK